ncbi:interferon-inducible GTPase-domain-containing protein [Kalaharituber pfeilii]|nr:interferon-inducible GTPase-domain-containing protein [Kalaharituber pfeilii]
MPLPLIPIGLWTGAGALAGWFVSKLSSGSSPPPNQYNPTEDFMRQHKHIQDELARNKNEIADMIKAGKKEDKDREAEMEKLREDYNKKTTEQQKNWQDLIDKERKMQKDHDETNRKDAERRQREFDATIQQMKRDREMDQQRMREESERREREAREHAERMQQENEQERARMQEEFERKDRERAEELARMQEQFELRERQREEERAQMEQERIQREQEMKEERAQARETQERMEREMEEERRRTQQEFEERLAEERRQQEEAHRRAEEELARKHKEQQDILEAQMELYKRGISPKVWPTEEEWIRARKRLVDARDRFHCAVAGVSGSGKSSLINALRGVNNRHPTAADVGITECTLDISAYPDSNTRWVWYDVPGAGTLSVPGPQYFNAQGLFVFDLIIVVIDNRFTSQDIAILQQCEYFKIPSFIVRSKANQHIKNIMAEELGYQSEDTDSEENWKHMLDSAKRELVKSTRASFSKNLRDGELNASQRVYIVSADGVRIAVTSGNTQGVRKSKRAEYMIDEWDLLKDLCEAVIERRYAGQQGTPPQGTPSQ